MEVFRQNPKKSLLSGCVGGLIGIGVSFIVNSTLAEISINPFFSVVRLIQYFGLLFTFVGCLILWKVWYSEEESRNKYLVFGSLVVISGILSFVLEKNWFVGMGPTWKIPLYGILGTSVCFALTFAIVDLVNYVSGYFSYTEKAYIENPRQILSVLVLSSVTGFVFGFIFGLLDVEDASQYQFQLVLLQEESYCYPIGAVAGSVTGLMVQYHQSDYEHPLDLYDEEIQ